jgi:phospholipase C
MRVRVLALIPWLAATLSAAQFPPQIRNIVVIVQENRTPDNLFHFLTPACPLAKPRTAGQACIPLVQSNCYDVSPCGLSGRGGVLKTIELKPQPLAGQIDPDHSHKAFDNMCDPDPAGFACQNDGAWKTTSAGNFSYAYVANPPVTNSDGSFGYLLDPYLTLAEQYGWSNFMYQTNQGPSYPAHQFLFSGTSAMTASGDANSTFVAENFPGLLSGAGCLASSRESNAVLSPVMGSPADGCTLFAGGSVEECTVDNTALIYPVNPVGTFCYSHQSMADVLDPGAIAWKYYAPSPGSIWTAPDSIQSICKPEFENPNGNPRSALKCSGPEWSANVDTENLGTDILRDIASCSLAQVSWVIPDGRWSDHAGVTEEYGPAWVAAIVNAIGNNARCGAETKDAGQKYWENTAIVVTWDDWGGWSDNQPPPYLSRLPCSSMNCPGDYQYGFRVPLIVVSAYTKAGEISNLTHDFGSILRMIEGINHLPEGQLGFADARATTDLAEFFTLATPRAYQTIPAEKDAKFFLQQKGAAVDPDDD